MTPYLDKIKAKLLDVVESGYYIGGEEVKAFENEFSDYLNVEHCISCGSGTDALQLALRTLGIGQNDKVVTVSHTAVATVSAIEMVGATPVLVDINPETFTIDTKQLRETLALHQQNDPIKAIIPVHLYGLPADMVEIMKLAEAFDALVIEDSAQADGAAIEGKKCGTWGHAAAFSFYPTKSLGAMGDGGAMVTNDPQTAEKAKLVKEYGWKERYISEIPGINSRLDTMQAAILRIRLEHLEEENNKRIRNAELLTSGLKDIASINTPVVPEGYQHVYHQYTLKVEDRANFREFLAEKGVASNILYPQPVHLQPAYGHLITDGNALSVTEKVCEQIVSIPVQPELTDDDINYIIATIKKYFDK